MPKFKLTITRVEDALPDKETSAVETLYVHHFADEAAARKLIHDITKPVRVYKPRAAKGAKDPNATASR